MPRPLARSLRQQGGGAAGPWAGARQLRVTLHVDELPTPALVVDGDALAHNIATMAAARPGPALRPHVKAFKCTALARELVAAGHRSFCAATAREMLGMAGAGLGDDLLLANELVDPARLRALAGCDARVTVAVDSEPTVDAAAAASIGEVLVDVDVGMPRCGCTPADAGRIAELARRQGLAVRGVMGYEGHLMTAPETSRADEVEAAMAGLLAAHADVGGDIVSGGGTGTYAVNRWCTEIQAGSYALMDTAYAAIGLPFRPALALLVTVVSVRPDRWWVGDGGLKALGMDHGDPSITGHDVWFCSDEHVTAAPADGQAAPAVGDRVRVWPAHVDPTVAYHDRLHVVQGDEVVEVWDVDLRGW